MRAERALEGADPRIRIAVRKIAIATLAVRTDVEHVAQPNAIPNSALPNAINPGGASSGVQGSEGSVYVAAVLYSEHDHFAGVIADSVQDAICTAAC